MNTHAKQVLRLLMAMVVGVMIAVTIEARQAIASTIDRSASNMHSLDSKACAWVGTTGGSIRTASGYQLEIPVASLGGLTYVCLSVSDQTAVEAEVGPIPGGITFAGALRIETGGVSFQQPVTVLIPNLIGVTTEQVLVASAIDINGALPFELQLATKATVVGDKLAASATEYFPGITEEGLIVFEVFASPMGFVQLMISDFTGMPVEGAVAHISSSNMASALEESPFSITASPASNIVNGISDIGGRVTFPGNGTIIIDIGLGGSGAQWTGPLSSEQQTTARVSLRECKRTYTEPPFLIFKGSKKQDGQQNQEQLSVYCQTADGQLVNITRRSKF